jgi:fructose-1,6-bisphosphatase-3
VYSGETPVKANGKMIIIDGGFCRAYHHTTGIAGYTMFFNSWGIRLAAHEPFVGLDDAIENNKDILSTSVIYESASKRLTVGMTDIGMELKVQVEELKQLLHAYRSGLIKER